MSDKEFIYVCDRHDVGECIDPLMCAPCSKDKRIAELEAERDRLRGVLLDIHKGPYHKFIYHTRSPELCEWIWWAMDTARDAALSAHKEADEIR